MANLSINAAIQEAESGAVIGSTYSFITAEDQSNRETFLITQGTEVQFNFPPVVAGKASFLGIRFRSLVDETTGDPATTLTWGYVTGTANHDHALQVGESHVVRLNLAKAATSIFVFCPAGTTDVYVEAHIWSE